MDENEKKKGFLKKIFDEADAKLKEKADKKSCCCCGDDKDDCC